MARPPSFEVALAGLLAGLGRLGFGLLGEVSLTDDTTSRVRAEFKKSQGFAQAAVQGIVI